MAYSCACCSKENTLYLGCISRCGVLQLKAIAAQGGTWILVLSFAGTLQKVETDLAAGDPIEFDLSQASVNEDFLYTATVYKPNGDLFLFNLGNSTDEYACISFKTTIGGDNVLSSPNLIEL